MRITLLQTDIVWEDKNANLQHLHDELAPLSGHTDLVILPEMFSTGFSMHTEVLAEPTEGPTICTLQQWAKTYQLALCGSYLAVHPADNCYYNRAFFLTPDGESYYYDKRHLFRMGQETEFFTAGSSLPPLIRYLGWNIRLLICYDLRFPVWSRNRDNAYDLLIYVANWPAARRRAWDILLAARAIENQAYVCGVNRTGTDGQQLIYHGGSAIYDPKGQVLAIAPDTAACSVNHTLSLEALHQFREKFPAWKDADSFEMPC